MSPTPTLLVTGFDPFGGDNINPSGELARALHGRRIGAAQVVGSCLPCAFSTALPALLAALQQHQPRWVLALGLAGSRSAISVERVAINLVDARIPDNAGAQPVDQVVLDSAPAAYFTGLPAKAIVADLLGAGHRAELSYSAGSFVCNQVFYALMRALAQRPGVVGGFIHLPPLPQQAQRYPAAQPKALSEQLAAIDRVLALLVAGQAELHSIGGRLD